MNNRFGLLRLSALLSLSLLTMSGVAKAQSKAVKDEIAKMGGTWSMVSAERDGQPVPEFLVKTGKREATGNSTSVTVGGSVILKATFTVDPTKKPKTVDYTLTDGKSAGKKQLGIYEFKGDTMKICFASPGAPRPKVYKTKMGDKTTVSVWKKDKK